VSRPYGRRPPYRRRDRLGFVPTMWLMAFGAILAYAVIGASHAHAASVESPVSICFALREGASLASIESTLLAQGYTETDAGVLTGQQVREHCPDMTQVVLKQIREAK
jgi:hypothetical protein